MPRMSKKRKQEWALFLNERNRITYNDLCRKCSNDCKQSFRCIVVYCPKYLSKRRTKNNDENGKSKGGQGGTPLPTTSLQTKSESVIVGYTHSKNVV